MTYKQTRINGLPNIGFSCSINAIIQILAQTPKLPKLLETEKSLDNPACAAFILLINDINGEHRPPEDVLDDLHLVRKTLFQRDNGGNVEVQNDCHLLLMRFINYMKDNGLTEAVSLFQVELIDIFEYSSCKCIDINSDQISYSLAIPQYSQKMSVKEGMDALLKEEQISLGCRKCRSSKQDKGECTRRLFIKQMPRILVLQLPRQIVNSDGAACKLHGMIRYEEEMTIEDADSKQFQYELYGVIAHLGSLNDGHYVAYVSKYNTDASSIWYRCSDENVTESTFAVTQNDDAYILFYKQI